MLDGFLSRTLHHVMGPLHALKGTCELVRDKIQEQNSLDFGKAASGGVDNEAEKNCELLERATETVMTTTRMVADVSDLARFDEGCNLKTKFDPVSLCELGTEAIESLHFNALRMTGGDDGISISLDLVGNGGPAALRTDRGVLLRVLAHLLENAVREVNSGGKVMLRITSSAGSNSPSGRSGALVEIIDDGKGLPLGTCLDQGEDVLSSDTGGMKRAPIHRYVVGNRGMSSNDPDQIQKARSEMEEKLRDLKQNGVGVGLPLSYHLVRSLGGDLRHDHLAEKGTRIWFVLPDVTDETKMEVESVALLKSQTVIKKHGQPPVSITLDINQAAGNKRRRTDDNDFATFSSDTSTSSSSETAETPMTAAEPVPEEPAPEAVAKCGVKASMPFSVLIVEDTDICKCCLYEDLAIL